MDEATAPSTITTDERAATEGHDEQRLTTVRALRELILAGEHYRLAVAVHLGVTVNESQVFSYLFVNGPMGQTDLARAMNLTTSTLTAMIDRLEARGYTERRSDPSDRRRSIVALSETGEHELAGVRHWMTNALESVADAEVEAAGELFRTVASSLRGYTSAVVDMESKHERPRRRI
ncbi:MarR family winged helix-turn-helix transcriptional regulator [Dermatophilaceae bacterium Soc4.6]